MSQINLKMTSFDFSGKEGDNKTNDLIQQFKLFIQTSSKALDTRVS